MKRASILICAIALALLATAGGFGQSESSLAITTNKTVVDGVVGDSEYSFSSDFDQLKLYANRTSDMLYLAIVGKTTGWVAVGLGSLKMDGATIFMGFVDADGKVQFKPQAGTGHFHKDTTQSVADTVASHSIKTDGDTTTLELALKPSNYITNGQAALELIFAIGPDKSFMPRHMYRGSLSLKLD